MYRISPSTHEKKHLSRLDSIDAILTPAFFNISLRVFDCTFRRGTRNGLGSLRMHTSNVRHDGHVWKSGFESNAIRVESGSNGRKKAVNGIFMCLISGDVLQLLCLTLFATKGTPDGIDGNGLICCRENEWYIKSVFADIISFRSRPDSVD